MRTLDFEKKKIKLQTFKTCETKCVWLMILRNTKYLKLKIIPSKIFLKILKETTVKP